MHVTFLADKLNISRGGSNFSLDLMARTLSERGHEVTIVTVNFGHENDLPSNPPYSIREDPVNSRTRVGSAKSVYRTLRDVRIESDIIHIFNPALLPVAGYFKKRNRESILVGRLNSYDVFCTNHAIMTEECPSNCTVRKKYVHDNDSSPLNVPKYSFDTFALPGLLNQFDRLLALSPTVQHIYESIGVDSEVFTQIPNFYDPSFAEGDIEPIRQGDGFSILYVGALREHKGVDILIRAADQLDDDIHISIIGDGEQKDDLIELSKRLEVTEAVSFLGRIDNQRLPGYYAGSDVFVHPGRWPEPFNRTLLEAMQCRCPIVASNIGAPPTIIESCGLTFERNDPISLAKVITRLISNPKLLRKFEENSQKRIKQYDPDRIISQLENTYLELEGQDGT